MADEKGKTRGPGRLTRFVAWRAKRWADSVLHGRRASEAEASAPEQASPAEATPPSEPVSSQEAAPPSEAPPPSEPFAEGAPSGPPAHWLRDVGALQRGPPADWVERVRKGAPHLLERMGLRYRPGQIPPEVAAALVAVERPEPEVAPEEPQAGEAPSEAPSPVPEPMEAGARRSEPRPFAPLESPGQARRVLAPAPVQQAPAPVQQAPRVEPGPERPVGAPVSRALAPTPSKPSPGEAGEVPAPARVPPEAPRPEAPARVPEAPRVTRPRAPAVARAPLPPVERAASVQPPRPPVARAPELEPPAPEVTAPTRGAVLAPAPPLEAESLAYRAAQASSREPTFRPQPAGRVRTEVLRVDVPVPVLSAREARVAPVWPELPEAQGAESVDGSAVLREWERMRRLEREQRGG